MRQALNKHNKLNAAPSSTQLQYNTSGNPCLQGTDGGPARVGWAPLAHRHTQGFFFFFFSLSNK
jgi:hypothetical protein